MRIIIAGGRHEADFIVQMFKEEKHELVVINPDIDFANYISSNHDVAVYNGDPTKPYALSDAEVEDADVLIALSEKDTDNYIICMIAKKLFNVRKCVSICRNPKNVDLFKKLGIDSVISSTYMLGQLIHNETSFQNVIKTLSMEDEKIVVMEVGIDEEFALVDQQLMNIDFPKNINISCIFRDPHVIIPKGTTMIKANDKLIIITTPSEQEEVIEYLQKRRS
jgi:trk system potassium uptake protein